MSLSVWQEPTFLLTLGVSVFSAALCELGMCMEKNFYSLYFFLLKIGIN